MTLLKIDIDDKADISNVILPQEYLNGLKTIFSVVIKFLKENDIEYFVDGGTLLGCVRERGQIPWDDDIDIGMNPSNFNKLRKVLPILSKLGFACDDQPDDVIKIICPDVAYVRNFKFEDGEEKEGGPRYAAIDVFMYVPDKKKRYQLCHKENQKLFPNCFYNKNDLYPLQEYDYHELKVFGANNPIPYLERYYGDWKKRCIHIYKE
jgi:lipopolysaccharide cholinephosphotransferase